MLGSLLSLFLMLPQNAHAKTIRADHVDVRVITSGTSEKAQFPPIGVHFKIAPEWHVYWKNPGDSGAAPKFQLDGGEIKNIQWPAPIRLPVGDFTNYGYDHEVVLFLDARLAAPNAKLKLEWLVCKVECVPGFGEFEIPKDVVADRALYEKFHAQIPKTSSWPSKFSGLQEGFFNFELKIPSDQLAQMKDFFVFPENGNDFKTALPKLETSADRLKISVPLSTNANINGQSQAMTFVMNRVDGSSAAFTQDISSSEEPTSLLLGLLLAAMGGMILNLMPCVFPVLFLKAFSFLKETDIRKVRASSWSYSFGVVISFVLFGGVLTALRLSGQAIGWGFQLQNALIVYGLALLFFAMALNFFGFFEMGDSLTAQGDRLSSLRFFSGSFGTGVLAVIVASPCTAPFMGSALGLTLLLPAYQSLMIFAALGVGMALPVLLLAYIPKLIHWLPRSGNWMIAVKQFMSFPLFATALWLLWVLGTQRGETAIFVSLASFLVFTMAIWILNISQKTLWRILAIVLLLGAPGTAFQVIRRAEIQTSNAEAKSLWTPYDEALLAEKLKVQPVFVDFTASWCITCQVNKKAVLETYDIQNLFKSHEVLLMKADWTNQDPVVTRALARFGRNSVPLYVFYNKISSGSQNTPQLLDEILTKDAVRKLFEKGESK